MAMRQGKQTFVFENGVYVLAGASIAGKKEGQGPLGMGFDMVLEDDHWGEDSYEKAERRMFSQALDMAAQKAKLAAENIDLVIGGDLLNQIISASFAARDFSAPFFGIYGACSNMAQSLLLGSLLVNAGYCTNVLCATSSHFSSAERQYRFPLEFGNQRTPTAQWTVTGAGATLLSSVRGNISITSATVGKIIDMGIKDANNMGAAMAPAAADTLSAHFSDTGKTPADYDLIITGDLGLLGKELAIELLQKKGYDVSANMNDCGCMIFDQQQDVHMGGSGCGCSATVLNSHLLNGLRTGIYKKILFASTGALLSPTSSLQGESIPGICHAICIEGGKV